MQFSKSAIFFFAFIEGLAVMSVEFIGAKILAPFFGTSLQVWTSVIGITMFALAFGYYIGGKYSQRKNGKKLLVCAIFGGSTFLLLMPIIASHIFILVSETDIYSGSIISSLLLLLPSIICFGMINPILIGNANKEIEQSGNNTGIVYAASTAGAVFIVLFLGFFIIPNIGVSIPAYIIASSFGIILIIISLTGRKDKLIKLSFSMGAILLICGLVASLTLTKNKTTYYQHKIIYESEGILGQLNVIDHYCQKHPNRMLYVNSISQTNEDIESGFARNYYVHRISTTSSFKPEGSRALILGMGGGSLVKEFINLKFNVDICEIDTRMAEVSATYFELDTSKVKIIIDDARHFINTCSKKYDIIVFDISLGEIQPSHLFTSEAFEELKHLLANNQSFVFFHYTDRESNELASRSLCKTLQSAGYLVKGFVPNPGLEDEKLFIALTSPPDMSLFIPNRVNNCCKMYGSLERLIELQSINTVDALVLSDDKPMLDILNRETITYYRNLTIKDLVIKRMKGKNF